MRPALPLCLLAAASLLGASAQAFEATARLGLASPMTDGVRVGPAVGLSVGVPIKGRLGILASGDFSTHALSDSPEKRIDAVTASLGLEVGIDLAPIVPTLSLGAAFQHAWREDDPGAKADKFGGFVGVGLRATLVDPLRLGLQARYFTTSFGGDSFPAYVTFSFEIGWTS